ncbi:MAG: CBS domain-containing protein [Kofleriaceae bacterium]
MKSLDTLPISPAFLDTRSKRYQHHRRTWKREPFEEEVTKELWLLGALVGGPAAILDEQAPLTIARELLLERRIPAIAVICKSGTLRGLITRTDILRTLAKQADATVADAMSGFVFVLPADATVEAAAALMAYEEVGQIVVVDVGGALVGIVSALDVARHVAMRAGLLAA